MNSSEYTDTLVEYSLTVESVKKCIMDLNYIDNLYLATEGMESIPESICTLTGYDLSVESSDIVNFKSKLSDLERNIGGVIDKKLRKITTLSSRVNEYNTNKLNDLYSKINDGVLVPRVEIDKDKVANFSKKLGVFTASGYDLTYGCKDLIAFIKGISDMASVNSSYFKGLERMHNDINTYRQESDIKTLNGILNLKKHLKGVNSSVSRKVTVSDYRMSIISKWISKNIDLITVSYHSSKGVMVSNEKLNVIPTVTLGIAKNKETLSLIDVGLSNVNTLKKSHKIISGLIKKSLSARMSGLLDSSKKEKRFVIARYNEKIITSLFNLYEDIADIDSIIIKYINITYETKKKK